MESSEELEGSKEGSNRAQELQPTAGIEHAEAGLSYSVSLRGFGVGVGEFLQGAYPQVPNQIGRSSALRATEDLMCVLEDVWKGTEEVPGSFEAKEWMGLFGWIEGRNGGDVSKQTYEAPRLVRFVNEVVASVTVDLKWSNVVILRNPSDEVTRSWLRRSSGDTLVMVFGRCQEGGLWVEGEYEGGVTACRHVAGRVRAGVLLEPWSCPARFEGERFLAIEPWQGDLWILKAGTTRQPPPQDLECRRHLGELGFELHPLTDSRDEHHRDPLCTRESTVARIDGDQASEAEGAAPDGEPSGRQGFGWLEEWDISFPHQVVDCNWIEGASRVHESISWLRKRLSQELSGTLFMGSGLKEIAVDLRRVMRECDWWEGLLSAYQPVYQVPISIKALNTEVPLREDEPPAVEQFLQTRTVSLEEAKGELDNWKQPAEEELRALEVTTRAVERITAAEVDGWVKSGKKVIQVPGKAVLTRKSGIGKRRFRAVCCGNFVPLSELNVTKEDLYAGGIDAITFRVALAYVSQFSSWGACTLDIKTAFLNAPVRGGGQVEGTDDPLIIVRPPFLLVQLGLLQANHRWLVRRALYGLQTSPRDWAQHRDQVMKGIKLEGPVECSLVQSVTDDSLWLLKGLDQVVKALVIVYVDDIAMFGPVEILEKIVSEIKAVWTISGPDWATPQAPLTFCGMELLKTAYGWKVTQDRYLRELLSRYDIHGGVSCPMLKFDEPPLEETTPAAVKDAQGITGALMWAVTRSRPDLMFVTSKMSQWSTKAPLRVKEWGVHALKYVSSTLSLGLEFREYPGPNFGSKNQLAVPREPRYLEVYSDASHSPGGGRSTQSTLIIWRGALVAWETSRQPFVTLSSAEAELVSMMHSVVSSESICPIVEELLQSDVVTSLLGDNSAALSAFNLTPSGWRSRHLRMRANAGRERIRAGTLTITYVPGELQVADIGTKALPGHKLLGLLELVNVRIAQDENPEPVVAKAFGRLCSVSLRTAERVSPATLLALIALSQPIGATGERGLTGGVGMVVLVASITKAEGQPGQWVTPVRDWMFWVVGALVILGLLVVGAACCLWIARDFGFWRLTLQAHTVPEVPQSPETLQAHTVPEVPQSPETLQAHTVPEVPQSPETLQAHTVPEVPQSPETLQAHTVPEVPQSPETLQAHTVPEVPQSPETLQAHAVPEVPQSHELIQAPVEVPEPSLFQGVPHLQEAVSRMGQPTEEPCEFPVVGRVDVRSNWVPTHFLRWILNVSGGSLVLCLGLTAFEVWRLRVLARSFRYGVAFAYEAALGMGPLPRRGGVGPVHDIADAALLLTPAGVQPGTVMGEVEPQGMSNSQLGEVNGLNGESSSELRHDSSEEDISDESAIDEVRHVPLPYEAVGPFGGGLAGVVGNLGYLSSESSGQSTAMLEVDSLGGADSMGDDHSVDLGMGQDAEVALTTPQGVAYRAVDGGLIVVSRGTEFLIPLEGWSMEEVGSIVLGIQSGDWTVFHQAMSMGPSSSRERPGQCVSDENRGLLQGSISYGSDRRELRKSTEPVEISANGTIEECSQSASESDELPDLEPLSTCVSTGGSETLEAAIWMVVIVHLALGSLFALGVCQRAVVAWMSQDEGSCQSFVELSPTAVQAQPSGLEHIGVQVGLFVWLASCWHRLGGILMGMDASWESVVVWIPGCACPLYVPSVRAPWVVWLMLVVLFGLSGFAEARSSGSLDEGSGQVQVSKAGKVESDEGGVCLEKGASENESVGWLLEVTKLLFAIICWETLKRVMCRKRRRVETVGSQTEGAFCVPLPLEPGVPNRAQILFCLWRAGYSIDVQGYPEDVQEDYFGLLGAYLNRQSQDEDSSDY